MKAHALSTGRAVDWQDDEWGDWLMDTAPCRFLIDQRTGVRVRVSLDPSDIVVTPIVPQPGDQPDLQPAKQMLIDHGGSPQFVLFSSNAVVGYLPLDSIEQLAREGGYCL